MSDHELTEADAAQELLEKTTLNSIQIAKVLRGARPIGREVLDKLIARHSKPMSITDEEALAVANMVRQGYSDHPEGTTKRAIHDALSHLLTLAERGRDRPISQLGDVADGALIVLLNRDGSVFQTGTVEQCDDGDTDIRGPLNVSIVASKMRRYKPQVTHFRLIQGER